MRYRVTPRYGARSIPRDLMLTPPKWRHAELTDAEEAQHERLQELAGELGNDGTQLHRDRRWMEEAA